MKKIFIDMDGVLTEYRKDCTNEDLAQKGYFLSLKPVENMVGALNRLIESSDVLGFSVCVLTKVYPSEFRYSVCEKLQWRSRYMPELFDSEFVLVNGEEQEKSDAVRELVGELDSDCILIDDYNANLAEWVKNGGTPVKYVNGINDKNRSFIGKRLTCDMSEEELYNEILAMIFTQSPAPAAA
ncbi:MAG: hypothetical protein K6C14_08210 [Eubacterium sp.]|nr:hypothetical protein [Eubacterium sp.]